MHNEIAKTINTHKQKQEQTNKQTNTQNYFEIAFGKQKKKATRLHALWCWPFYWPL